MSNNYAPNSHFFVDETNLTNVGSSTADAFGPIGTAKTQYRTTSTIRSSAAITKVYAICKGRILIQPQEGSSTEINIILKPDVNISPLKIKYFIYRGVNKSDWIDAGNNLKPKALSDGNQPTVLQKIWDSFTNFYSKVPGSVVPSTFPATSIGYILPVMPIPQQQVDTSFYDAKASKTVFKELIKCDTGDFIGNFSGAIGLDIILDNGDYQLKQQDELFKIDLEFAWKKEFVFDIAKVPSSSGVRIQRYREYVLQFMDAAAYWGSHINCGSIKLSNNTAIQTADDINNYVLNFYLNKNKIYFYIQGERGRSYNFYDAKRMISFELTSKPTVPPATPPPPPAVIDSYKNNDWPILIKEYVPNAVTISSVTCLMQYNVDNDVYPADRYVSIDIIAPDNKTDSFPVQYSSVLSGVQTTDSIEFNIHLIAAKPSTPSTPAIPAQFCSSFMMIYCSLNQKFPLQNYYDYLWPVNFETNNLLPTDIQNYCYWTLYDKNRMVNLRPVLAKGASVSNKVIVDNGKNSANISLSRRLFMAMVKRSSDDTLDYYKLNIDPVSSGITKNPTNQAEYIKNLYTDSEYSIYKGQLDDGGTLIHTLSLAHNKDFEKKMSYFQIGITDVQYNNILLTIPVGSDNVFFHLEKVLTIPSAKDFMKFILGLTYENALGTFVTIYPSVHIDIYTVDGLYFFSKEYSDSQNFYNTFSDTIVDFRPKSDAVNPANNWTGEFGFDWIRIWDTALPGDSIKMSSASPPVRVNRNYYDNLGHYYITTGSPPTITNKKGGPNDGATSFAFQVEKIEWMAFRNNYPSYTARKRIVQPPVLVPVVPVADYPEYYMYSASFLSLYPSLDSKGMPSGFPKKTSSGKVKCFTESVLYINIEVLTVPTSLKIKYETDFFNISSEITPGSPPPGTVFLPKSGAYSFIEIINKSIGNRVLVIKVKALKESVDYRKIQVLATESGNENIAGELWVLPNAKAYRRTANLSFINIKTNVSGSIKNGVDFSNKGIEILEDIITPFFNQALIDIININQPSHAPLEIDATPTSTGINDYPNFNADFQHLPAFELNVETSSHVKIHTKLAIALIKKYGNLYSGNFILFYMDEEAQSAGFYFSGVAEFGDFNIYRKYVALFRPGLIDSTSAHELFHTLRISHTFANQDDFTMTKFITDNIADYSAIASSEGGININTVSTWRKQWKIIWQHNLIGNEI